MKAGKTRCHLVAGIAAFVLTAGPVLARPIIVEVVYDGPGTDADDVFTEIVGEPGFELDGWTLVGINGGSGSAYQTVDLTGVVIPADGVLVLATDKAAGEVLAQRDVVAAVDWQNGPDAVQLRNPDDEIVDALQYGDAGAFNAGEGTPAPTVSAGQSLSRDAEGSDTDDNLADFTPRDSPSPGVVGSPPSSAGIAVSLPDTVAAHGGSLRVPLRLGDTSGQGIVAAEFFISYGGAVLSLVEAAAGALAGGHWTLATNTAAGSDTSIDTLKIAMATSGAPLTGAGALMDIHFAVATQRRPAQAPLVLEHVLFNDGTPGHSVEHGGVRVTGVDGTLIIAPEQLVPPETIEVSIVDADEDRDPLAPDVLAVRAETGAQSEDVTVVETGNSSGVFTGSLPVAPGAAVADNEAIETDPGSTIEFCYDDSLNAAGQTVELCATAWVSGGRDGRVEMTAVSQPGDTLRIQVVDADLNADPAVREATEVDVLNRTTADSKALVLTEISVDDSVFFGMLKTVLASSSSTDGVLATQGADTIQVHYVDERSLTGSSVAVLDTGQVVGLFGDADGNGQVQAFDASRVLTHALSPFLAGQDSLAANVDALAPLSAITPYDAALILQHRVGMRRLFPVQEAGASNHPKTETGGAAPRRRARECLLALRMHDDYVSVWAGERQAIVSGELALRGLSGRVEPGAGLDHFLYAWRSDRDELRIVLAGATPVSGPGELLRIYPPETTGTTAAVRLERARFNDGRILGRSEGTDLPGVVPTRLALYSNRPNPFNPETTIRFDLPYPAFVRLEIFTVPGQRLRTLVAQELPAGVHHVVWNGRDERGMRVSSGVYVYRLQTRGLTRTRRMLLLK